MLPNQRPNIAQLVAGTPRARDINGATNANECGLEKDVCRAAHPLALNFCQIGTIVDVGVDLGVRRGRGNQVQPGWWY
jgi:hypothetical protein